MGVNKRGMTRKAALALNDQYAAAMLAMRAIEAGHGVTGSSATAGVMLGLSLALEDSERAKRLLSAYERQGSALSDEKSGMAASTVKAAKRYIRDWVESEEDSDALYERAEDLVKATAGAKEELAKRDAEADSFWRDLKAAIDDGRVEVVHGEPTFVGTPGGSKAVN